MFKFLDYPQPRFMSSNQKNTGQHAGQKRLTFIHRNAIIYT
jgi:hypothetical protein